MEQKPYIPPWVKKARQVVFIVKEAFDPDNGYMAFTATEGVFGITPTNCYYGFDYNLAVWYANRQNLFMGIDKDEASFIIACATHTMPILNELPI